MFERFFNYSNELLCIASLDGKFIQVNDAFINCLGFDKAYLLSESFLNLVHPDDVTKTVRELECLGAGKEIINFENRYISASKEIKILNWKATFDQETQLIFATARDVTSERLISSRYTQLYQAITKNIIFAKTDVKGVICEVNQKFCDISGYSSEELIGKTHKIVNSGCHDKAFFKEMWATISSGQVWTGLIKNRKKDGDLYIVESIIIPVFDLDKKIEAFIALRQDITERIHFQKLNDKTLEMLNQTGEIAKVGGWELNVETQQLTCTQETYKIFNLGSTHNNDTSLLEVLSCLTELDQQGLLEDITFCEKQQRAFSRECLVSLQSGEKKWVNFTGKPNKTGKGAFLISGTVQDIHEKKSNEIKFKQERQKSIQNAKFSALGELAASVAHEINNPLGIISGYAELLQMQGGSEDDKYQAILKSCDRITHIVKNLKRFSRTDDTPQKLPVNLLEVVNDAISLTLPRAKRQHSKIYLNAHDEVWVLGNHIELEQVIINLINNALDALAKHKLRTVTVELMKQDMLPKLVIEDTGGGVCSSVIQTIFEPFVTTKLAANGTGLGLSVVKGILDDHLATIAMTNNELGASFVITFPATEK
ncbi:PAS domain-containing sensor histidine kinase [Pseudoalteromonas phenolica]|uniref:histidine kinase n=1 Tax=Pseudoalteromonas phenolica TaxID=161398 RepID=A0A5R9Q375_9GAMM|nr:PAS domain-containing sensor histidine kinase [Pseudoalteromonas phenolica]TLX47375.1 PAS domain-containing sensor histidine kinase [Pseudoalteromonas phenolica]